MTDQNISNASAGQTNNSVVAPKEPMIPAPSGSDPHTFHAIDSVLKVAETLPIPGISEVMAPVRKVAEIMFDSSTASVVLRKLEEIDKRIQNIGNVFGFVLNREMMDFYDKTIERSKIPNLLDALDNDLGDPEKQINAIDNAVDKLSDSMTEIIILSEKSLQTYENGQRNRCPLISYINAYSLIAVSTLRCYARTQSVIDLAYIRCEQKVRCLASDGDEALASSWARTLKNISQKTERNKGEMLIFSKETIMKFFPNWLKPLTRERDHFSLRSFQSQSYFLSRVPEFSNVEVRGRDNSPSQYVDLTLLNIKDNTWRMHLNGFQVYPNTYVDGLGVTNNQVIIGWERFPWNVEQDNQRILITTKRGDETFYIATRYARDDIVLWSGSEDDYCRWEMI